MTTRETVLADRRADGSRPLRALAVRVVRSHALWRVQRHDGMLMAAVTTGAAATAMSTTLPAMAIPLLSVEFGLGQDQAQWTSTAFLLAMAGSMLATPWLVRRAGLYRHYALAITALLAGAIACSHAASFDALLVGRVLQGLATGVLQPVPALVVLRCCGAAQRGRVTGLMGLGTALAVAVGPGAAGLLMALFGWRAVFWLSWPLCLAALLLIRCASQAATDLPASAGGQRLDWPGLLLVNLGTAALINGLVQLRLGNPRLAAALAALAAMAALAFLAWQLHLRGQSGADSRLPLLNPSLFRHGQFVRGCVATLFYGALLYGSSYLLPQLMQRCLGAGVNQVGATLLCAGLAMVVAMPLAGRQLDRHPGRPLASIGFALLTLSLAAMPWLRVCGWLPLTAGAALARLGLGVALASSHVTALRGLPAAMGAQGASVSSFMQSLGGALGASLCGVFLDWRLAVHQPAAGIAAAAANSHCIALDETFGLLALLGLLAAALASRMRSARRSA